MTATLEAPAVAADAAAALEWMGRLVLDDDGTTWGESAAPFQMTNALELLDTSSPVRQFFIPGVRGARKTTDLAGIALAVLELQAPRFAKAFFASMDEEAAGDLVTVAAELIARTPGLKNRFTTTGLVIRHIRKGATFTALANDPSAMGKQPYMIVADELSGWPDTKPSKKFWTAMTTAIEKVPGCRLVVLTNAGNPEHWSYKRYEVALKSVHWKVLEVPAPLPWLDDAALLRGRENCQTEAEYERLFLNIWTAEDGRLATAEDIAAAKTLSGPLPPQPGVRYVGGLDIGIVNDRTAFAIVHAVPEPEQFVAGEPQPRMWRVVLDRIVVWQGTRAKPVDLQDVERQVAALAAQYDATVVFDPSQAILLGQRLRSVGVLAQAYHFHPASLTVLATTMISLIRDRRIDLPADDAELLDELAHVNVRETTQHTMRLDHDAGRHDDRAIALALAAQHLLAGTRAEWDARRNQRVLTLSPRWSRIRDRGNGADPRAEALLQQLASYGDPAAQRALKRSTGYLYGRR